MGIKPSYEIIGSYHLVPGETWRQHDCAEFDTVEDAIKFGEANLEEYAIYMKLKIEEKKNGTI